MVRPGRERLSGSVEVDETYLGGVEEGTRGRGTESKALILRIDVVTHGRVASGGKFM